MQIYAGMKLKIKKDPCWLAGKTPAGTVGEIVTSQLVAKVAPVPFIILEFYAPGLKSRSAYRRGTGSYMSDENFNDFFQVIL